MPSYRQGNASPPIPPEKKKIEYIALQRITDGMTEGQKLGVQKWNLMVRTLRENGLMEDK